MEKGLSKRKQEILKAVVDEYITTAVPVSSGEISKKYMAGVSSATIRSELAALEEMGYLDQPHISAGRVPLPRAYKLYVDKFMEGRELTPEEIAFIRSQFTDKMTRVEDIVKQTAKVISDVTNYTSVVVLNDFKDVTINEIKMVPLGDGVVLIIIITDHGVFKDKTIEVPVDISDSYIQSSSAFVNKVFSAKTVEEALTMGDRIQEEFKQYQSIFDEIIEVLNKYSEESANKVYMEGALKMLDYPECTDVTAAKKILSVLSEKEQVASLVEDGADIEFAVKIGKDDETCGLEKCAIVSAKYKINGKEIGHAGVIGPDRMDYNKVISVLKYVCQALDEILDKE